MKKKIIHTTLSDLIDAIDASIQESYVLNRKKRNKLTSAVLSDILKHTTVLRNHSKL